MRSFVVFAILVAIAVSAMGQLPKVSHIWPDTGMDGQSIIAHIYGADFQSSPVSAARLTRSAHPDIEGSSIAVVSDHYLTCSFDLIGHSVGLRDLVLENASGLGTLASCFTVYSPSDSPSVWEKTVVGANNDWIWDVAVGDGNKDGTAEVYGASRDGNLYEFEWDGATWQKDTVGSGQAFMYGIGIGDGDYDTEIEVYAANTDSLIYQFEWDGAQWQETTVGRGGNVMNDVEVGDGDSDGLPEVFAVGDGGLAYQFEWSDSNWAGTPIGSTGVWVVAVGDGNDDGELEVYGANLDSNDVLQFKWDGMVWVRTTVGYGRSGFRQVVVGDGDSDGETELYAANKDDTLYQFKWNGADWQKGIVGCGNGRMVGVAAGDGDGDGGMELYGACADSTLYQFKWNGATWVRTVVGSGAGEMVKVAVGDGNGDGEMEVYATNRDEQRVYMFKAISTGVQEFSQPDPELGGLEVPSGYPNPASSGAAIRFNLLEEGHVTLRVYGHTGQLVRTLIDGLKEPGEHMILWDGRDDKGEKLPSGSYFYQVEAAGVNSVKKLVLVR